MTTNAALIYQLDNAFWRFSLAVYQNNPVKTACLSLQESYNANVNLLLLCCWLAYSVEDISQDELLETCHKIDNWHSNVTQSLRQTRRWVKSLARDAPWINDFAQQVLMDEIISETYQQHLLYSCFENKQKKHASKNETHAICYLVWLFEDMRVVIDEKLEAQLKNLVQTIFSTVTIYENPSAPNRD